MLDQLRPYQEEGAAFLAERRRAMLADEMGLGKSAQAAKACAKIGAKTVAVVSPASVKETLRREFQKWAPDAGFQLYSYSYDGAVSHVSGVNDPPLHKADAIVIDEAHFLKNSAAKRTKVLYPEIEKAPVVYALTGTPCPNNPSELYTHLRHLAPERILTWKNDEPTPWRERDFLYRYCKVIDTGYGPKIVGAKNMDDLRQRLDGFMLRRKKKDVLTDLPPIRFGEIALRCPPEDWRETKSLDTAGWDKYLVADELPPADEHVARARRLIAVAKAKALTPLLAEELEADPAYKVVVFGWHSEALGEMLSGLARFGAVAIAGYTPVTKRQEIVDKFQTDPDCRVFIGQIQAAGTGLTLTAASNLVFLEMSWTPGDNAQAAMRVHRIGQTESVFVRFAQLAGTIDESVVRTLGRKTQMLAELFA